MSTSALIRRPPGFATLTGMCWINISGATNQKFHKEAALLLCGGILALTVLPAQCGRITNPSVFDPFSGHPSRRMFTDFDNKLRRLRRTSGRNLHKTRRRIFKHFSLMLTEPRLDDLARERRQPSHKHRLTTSTSKTCILFKCS